MPSAVFGPDFLYVLKASIDIHNLIYPTVPPQGIYFEALVEKAYREIKKPFTLIKPGGTNQPRHDLLVEDARISLKTETGLSTRLDSITITKLCTTEQKPWTPDALKKRVIAHLGRYEVILMLRAIWQPKVIVYQLVDIPVDLLKLIEQCDPEPVGKLKERRSLGADVLGPDGKTAFHVHFDGSDGKCSVRGLRVELCEVLLTWDKERPADLPIHTGKDA